MSVEAQYDAWGRLYRTLEEVRRLAPWQWLEETHIFGVEHPQTGEVGYFSVQGAHDEEPGIFLYLGDEGWSAYWALVEFAATAGTVPEEMIFSVPMLAASWGEREELTEQEIHLLEQLNLSPEEDGAWPVVRSFRPGWSPWPLEEQEAEFLATALEQFLALVPMLRDEGGTTLLTRLSEGYVLVRARSDSSGQGRWVSEWRPIPGEETLPYRIVVPGQTLDEYRRMLPNREEIQLDFFMLPTAVEEQPGERPYIPYLLLIVDKDNDALIDALVLHAREGVRVMFERIPAEVITVLHKHQTRPARLAVRTERLYVLLEGLARELSMDIQRRSTLRPLDRFRVMLLERVVNAGYPDEGSTLYLDVRQDNHHSD